MTGLVLFAIAAAVAALLVDRARARHRALERQLLDLTVLAEMGEMLQLATAMTEVTDVVPAFAPRLFPGCDGAVYVGGMTPDSLAMVASWGEPSDMLAFAPADCWALRRARPHAATAADVACRHKESDAPALCVPVAAAAETIGVVVLRGAPALEGRVQQVAEQFARQVARALAGLRAHETLRMHAVRDELTGLYNRRYLHDALVRELRRADADVGVIVADVDNFKRYNDTWGHPGGDALLQHFARMTQRVLRADDIVCRYGGEEFVIVVPNASLDLLFATAERLREECAHMHVRHDGHLLGRVTVSAGIAHSSRHGSTVEELIAAADRALYTAKTSGRDRVAAPPQHPVAVDAA